MRRTIHNDKHGLMDEFADDLFAFFILLFTFITIILIYQASTSSHVTLYKTNSFEHSMSRSLNEFLGHRFDNGLTIAQVITDTEHDRAPDLITHWAKYHFHKELGTDIPWTLSISYPEKTENTGKDTLKVEGFASGSKKTYATASLPGRDGGRIDIHLLVSPKSLRKTAGTDN